MAVTSAQTRYQGESCERRVNQFCEPADIKDGSTGEC